ncbi:MAG: hypothetical protein RDU25_04670 [Patescibacteria group bacterium]|nr:hypothetical protein [Patescibacteria group bacterium]
MNSKMVSLVAMVAMSLSTFVGCGDNSEGSLMDESNAAGASGTAGGSQVNPPTGGSGGGAAGTGGSVQTGGSSGSSATGGSSGSTATGGSSGEAGTGGSQAGSGGSEVNPPSGGSGGGEAGTGGAAGSAGEAGSAGTGGTSGTGGSSGTGGEAGTGGTAGSGGSVGTVCVPGAKAACALTTTCMGEATCKADGSGYEDVCEDISNCNGGSGGSAGTGGAGGAAGSGGSSGTGGSGGSAGSTGTMLVTVVVPVSGTHNITLRAQSLDPVPGEVDWNTVWTENNVTRTTYSFSVGSGKSVKVNGYYDPESGMDPWAKKFCDAVKAEPTAAIWATYNGSAVPAPEVVVNGPDSCDFVFHAVTLVPTANDADGDGEPDADDCADNDSRRFHGQVETPDDDIDFDCDGMNAPRRVRYRLTSISGLDPILQDWDRNGLERHMSSIGSGLYEVLVEEAVAPVDFTIKMGIISGWATWDVGYDNGECKRPSYVPVAVTVSDEVSNSLYNLVMELQPGNTCHDKVANL